MSSIINNNNQYGESGDNVPEKLIQVTGGGKTDATSASDLTAIRAAIITGKQYKVELGNNTQGYVHTIKITDLSAGGNS